MPSDGEVPRPSSSIKINELEDAIPSLPMSTRLEELPRYLPRIIAEEAISLANVLRPFSILSSFERRDSKASWILYNQVVCIGLGTAQNVHYT